MTAYPTGPVSNADIVGHRMPGKRSGGLRNKHRSGRGPYSRSRKCQLADYYGEWINGRQITPDKIRRWEQPE